MKFRLGRSSPQISNIGFVAERNEFLLLGQPVAAAGFAEFNRKYTLRVDAVSAEEQPPSLTSLHAVGRACLSPVHRHATFFAFSDLLVLARHKTVRP